MATQTKLNELFLSQKKAVRSITNSNYRAHTAPLFKETGILPLNNLITYSQLKFMHRFVNNKQPFSFNLTWLTNHQLNPQLQLRNANNFRIPAHRIDLFKRSSLVSFPTAWNSCQEDKYNGNEKTFLKSVKRRLLQDLV
jgi:hypothetical protein